MSNALTHEWHTIIGILRCPTPKNCSDKLFGEMLEIVFFLGVLIN